MTEPAAATAGRLLPWPARLGRTLAVGCLALGATLHADDWPQWRGPERNGLSREQGWLAQWPHEGLPPVAWSAQVGQGHACVSVADGRAYTLGWDGAFDTLWCFDADAGTLLWQQSYPCETLVQWPGPRATPVIEDGRVFTLGQHGQLRAWDAAAGTPLWQFDLPAHYMPDVDYGFAWSPLVVDDVLIVCAGSRGLALDKRTGAIVWGDDGQAGACASPVPFRSGGQSGVAVLTVNPGRESVSLVGVSPQTGRELWRSPPWAEFWGAACVDPVFEGDHVFLTTSEQYKRCARFTIGPDGLTEDWSNEELVCYTSGCVLWEGCLYGVDQRGILACLDWETGEPHWAKRGYDERGTLIAADGCLLIQTGATGELAVVAADPQQWRELRRCVVFAEQPETYTAPVLANGRIYCRSYEGQVVCLDLTRSGP